MTTRSFSLHSLHVLPHAPHSDRFEALALILERAPCTPHALTVLTRGHRQQVDALLVDEYHS